MDNLHYGEIRNDIIELLQAARAASARSVNALMTATYWEIGRRIVEFEQQGQQRAEYGETLIKQLAVDLTRQFGRGFGAVNLSQMRRFYLEWPAQKIFQTPSEKLPALPEIASKFSLPWSAYVRLLSVKRPEARTFYETEALRSGWSVRQLDRQIGSQFYERVALSRNKAAMLEKAEIAESGDAITPEEAIKDPFVLEFLGLKDEYSETQLEEGLIEHLTDFLLELGDDFAFLARQRRLRIDDTWFRVDLLLFHRLPSPTSLPGRNRFEGGAVQLCRCRTNAPVLELRTRALDERGREPSGRTDSLCGKGYGGSSLCSGQSTQ